MTHKTIGLVCEQCHKPFRYILKKSNNRKHLCDDCSEKNIKESQRVHEEKRRKERADRGYVQRLLMSIPERPFRMERVIEEALRIAR